MKRLETVKPASLYVVLFVFFLVVLFSCFFFSNGNLISRYYIWDEADTGMDYFNSLAYARDGMPYTQYQGIYPPLANLFFYASARLVPRSASDTWETSYDSLIEMRQTERDLRTYQSTMLPFLLYIGLICALVGILIQYILREKKGAAIKAIPLTTILSFGFTWGIERGNIILLAFFFSLFFLAFYHSPRKELREFSYICLSLAAGLKIYPAFLGLLLVYDKNWKAVGRTVLYGVVSLVLPCFFISDGINGLAVFIQNLFSFGSRGDLGLHHTGSGLQDFFGNILAVAARLFHVDESQLYQARNALQWISYLACVAMLIQTVFYKGWKNWQRITILCLIMNSFQSGAYYTLIYLLLPLVFFLLEEELLTSENLLFFIPLSLVSLHIPLFDLDSVKMKAFLIQGSVVALWIVIVYVLVRKKHNNAHVERTEKKIQI